MLFFQRNFLLKANTRYRLSFAARSSTSDAVVLYLHRNTWPYTNNGLNGVNCNLSQSWQIFSTEFTTTGFPSTTTDTRLRFWFIGQASNGEIYLIDDVTLEEIASQTSASQNGVRLS